MLVLKIKEKESASAAAARAALVDQARGKEELEAEDEKLKVRPILLDCNLANSSFLQMFLRSMMNCHTVRCDKKLKVRESF